MSRILYKKWMEEMDWKNFCEKIELWVNDSGMDAIWNENELRIIANIEEENILSYEYSKEDYNDMQKRIENSIFKNGALYNGKKYELMVTVENSIFLGRRLIENPIYTNNKDFKYSLEHLSDEFIVSVLELLDTTDRIKRRPFHYRKYMLKNVESIFDIIRETMPPVQTVVVESKDIIDVDNMEIRAKSFLFNLSCNFGVGFRFIDTIDEVFKRKNMRQLKRMVKMDEVMPPELKYNEKLVSQYYMAISSGDAFVKFIGFYHIMEYFFNSVYTEELLDKVRSMICDPKFSVKRNKDVSKIVNLIKKKARTDKNGFQGTEKEALMLTLKKYIDIENLKDDISDLESNLIEYYEKNPVAFSKGDSIKWEDSNEKIYKDLSNRIYKTRNSLIHSKSDELSEKERETYKPFVDEKVLIKEIPLMRCIAEQIIIKTANKL